MVRPDVKVGCDAAVHENTPEGWYVGTPGSEERYRQWSTFAFGPSEPAVDG